MDVLLVDAALALAVLGCACFVRPLPSFGVGTRRRGVLLALAGFGLLLVGLLLPVSPPRLAGPRMAIDEGLPDYQFGEVHETLVRASPERVLEAAEAVTAGEIRFFRLLTWLRSPRLGRGRESILHAPADEPLLQVALRSGFLRLREDPGHEIVFGSVVCCDLARRPRDASEVGALQGSLARAVMNFHVEALGPAESRLVTETRVAASDARAERRFAVYWRLIYPGSAFIRRMWLRAIKARAEAAR